METKPLAARTAAAMLKEGAGGMTGQHMSEQVDYYGGSLSTNGSLDIARAQLFTLSKYEAETIPYLAAVWLEPDFPEEELLLLKQNRIQKLKESLRKPDTVSYRNVTELLYGVDHPYGYNSSPELYEVLSIDDIKKHYHDTYSQEHTHIIATGNVTDETLSLLDSTLGQVNRNYQAPPYVSPNVGTATGTHSYSLGDSYQTGIKVGRRLFHRRHRDYAGMFILNVLLGGYFGSRLMSSIREDKGYTYNVFSSLGTLVHDGFFYISTEVDHTYAQPTIAEIFNQLAILRTTPIPKEELLMVKNYILGHLLGMLDGPFNMSQLIRSYMVHKIGKEDFDHLHRTVSQITAEELMRLAQQYLQADDMVTVIVGQ
jgi:predicted Zn-dependent peptidase